MKVPAKIELIRFHKPDEAKTTVTFRMFIDWGTSSKGGMTHFDFTQQQALPLMMGGMPYEDSVLTEEEVAQYEASNRK